MSSRFWFQINNVDPEFFKVSLVTQNSLLSTRDSKSKTENDFILHQLPPVVLLLLPVNTSDTLKFYRSFCLARYLSIMPHDMEP